MNEPASPAEPTTDAYCVTGYGVDFYVHLVQRAHHGYFVAACGDLGRSLPDRVQPTSSWLMPCEDCFPDGRVPGDR